MSYGEFPDIANDYSNKSMLLPSGVILGGDLKNVHDVDLKAPDQVQEWVTHSWYKQGDEAKGLHPFDGVTDPNFVLGPGTKGTRTNIENLDESAKYSWVKSPRWKGNAVEVGPLARYIVAYARGNKEIQEQVNGALKTLDVPITALFSTLGRTAARGLECQWAAHKMKYFYDAADGQHQGGRPRHGERREMGTVDVAGRGEGRRRRARRRAARSRTGSRSRTRGSTRYQCVVPTTWNAGPRDPKGQIGAYEAALLNTPMVNPAQPLEILRTIHSFDPCLACATHVMSPEGEELVSVKVR